MRDRLVKLSESGQGLNNNLKLIIVAVASFSIGVAATYTYQSSELSDPVLTPRQKELQEIAIQAERTPFFPAAGPVGKAQQEALPITKVHSEETPAQEIDYLKLTSDIKEFKTKLEQESTKKYDEVKLYERAHIRKKEYLLSKMDYFRSSKKNWYKASFSSPDTGPAKFTFYMNYYNCGKDEGQLELPRRERSTLNNSCYVLWGYIYLNGKWDFYSMSSNIDSSVWKDDIPFLPFNMEEMGDLPRETNILKAYVPIADTDGPISFLKYESGKFEWIDAGELRWVVTSSKEAEKFQKIITTEAIKEITR